MDVDLARDIANLCAHPTHAISAIVILKKQLADTRGIFVVVHSCKSYLQVVPFMAVAAHYVSAFRGMQVADIETKLRQVAIRRQQPLVYPNAEEKVAHVQRIRDMLDKCRQLRDEEYEFKFILVEVPAELEVLNEPFYMFQHGSCARLPALEVILNILREKINLQ